MYKFAVKGGKEPKGVIVSSRISNVNDVFILQSIKRIRHDFVLHQCPQNTVMNDDQVNKLKITSNESKIIVK